MANLILLSLCVLFTFLAVDGKCNDRLTTTTQIRRLLQTTDCSPAGNLQCGENSYTTYSCSPPVTTSTQAILTNNDFSQGGDGGAASECDGSFHDNSESIVALSTGWYSGGSRCGSMITITASNGRSTMAKVVDECDSMRGCDDEHAGLPPCRYNIVDASNAVWNALGLDTNDGEASITWSTA